MMGGRLERATDEVADLVASRPAWMNGDPASFSEEQLREYKEYCAKEQAAIEERLKRKAVMVSGFNWFTTWPLDFKNHSISPRLCCGMFMKGVRQCTRMLWELVSLCSR